MEGKGSESTDDLVGKRLAHFTIEAKLGEGGMGVVYRATDEKLHRVVALKVLPERFSQEEEARRRLLREARAIAAVVHPNIATVYEIGEDAGRIFVAMEHIAGRTLADVLDQGPLTVAHAVHVARSVLRGIGKAHEKGIFHRDLKPSNVVLSDDGDVKVLDFGIAKFRELDDSASASERARATTTPADTKVGLVAGTVGFMAPEQMEGLPIDERADIFSFGAVFYEMLTGRPPFPGRTVLEVLLAMSREDPPLASEINSAVDADLARVVARCLARDRERRYRTARDVLDAMNPATQPIESAPASKAASGKRRRAWVLAPLVVLVMIPLAGARLLRPVVTPAASSSPAGAGAPHRGRSITDHPEPKAGSAEARSAYGSALLLLREASYGAGILELARAARLDPSLAAANLRLLVYESDNLSSPQRRERFEAAWRFRHLLDERDLALLAVAEEWTKDTPDLGKVASGFVALLDRFPDDAELLFLLGSRVLALNGRLDEARGALRRAYEVDPGYVAALWELGIATQFSMHDEEEALRIYNECLSVAPRSASCLFSRGLIESHRGQCGEFEADARRRVELEPDLPVASGVFAQALASRHAPLDAVRAALDTMVAETERAPDPDPKLVGSAGAVTQLWTALLAGNLPAAETLAKDLDRLAARDSSGTAHARLAMTLIDIYEEENQSAAALAVAESYDRRSGAWSADGFPIVRAYLAYARHRSGQLDDRAFSAARQSLLDATERDPQPDRDAERLLAWASYATTPTELQDAVGYLSGEHSVAPSHPLLDVFPGRVLFLAGHVDEALPRLRRAARQCAILPSVRGGESLFLYRNTVLSLRAHLLLGQALEAKGGAAEEACEAYRFVLDLWKDARPRSVTLEKARKRFSALRCAAPT